MKKILLILFIIVYGISYSQENNFSDCTLQTNNKQWKEKFKKADGHIEQIEMIKFKIKDDSLYDDYIPKLRIKHTPSITNQHIDKKGNKCGCKILFVLYYTKNKSILLDLNSNPKQVNIVENLNNENTKIEFYLFDKKAQALYGTLGECGVVQMRTTDKSLKRIIKHELTQK